MPLWHLDGEMYEWMDVWKNLFIYVVVCVCVLMGLGWFRYGFADVLKNMSAGLPNLWDTARHSPSSCCCRRTCCWASWLESSAKASNNNQSSTITPATTLSTSIPPQSWPPMRKGKAKYLQHSATWTPTPLAFSSLSASTSHSCSLLPLLLQLLELCPLPPVSGIT